MSPDPTSESQYLRALAHEVCSAYRRLPSVRAVLLTGSAAAGTSDRHSDIDLPIYHEKLPALEELEAVRAALGVASVRCLGSPEEESVMEIYRLRGVEIQIPHVTIDRWEHDMASVREQFEVRSPLQKAISGLLSGTPLYGETQIAAWKRTAADYPVALAEAMVREHLSIFPLWLVRDVVLPRDATVWTYELLVQASQNLLGILAGLNRVYYSPFQFKRMHDFAGKLTLAPPELADRLEALFREPDQAPEQLEALVAETVALVRQHLPAVDVSPIQASLGQRRAPWQPVASDEQVPEA